MASHGARAMLSTDREPAPATRLHGPSGEPALIFFKEAVDLMDLVDLFPNFFSTSFLRWFCVVRTVVLCDFVCKLRV